MSSSVPELQDGQSVESPTLERPQIRRHHALRLASAAIAIVATRHLYVDNFHYPVLLLLSHSSAALLLELCVSRRGSHSPKHTVTTWTSRLWQLVFAALVATTLVLSYQALLHTLNTTLFLMMMCLSWTSVLRWVGRQGSRDKRYFWNGILCVSTFILCAGLLLVRETRLTGKAAKLILAAAISVASTKTLWESGLVDDHLDLKILHPDAYLGGLMLCLPLTGVIVGITRWHTRRDFSVTGRMVCIATSLVAAGMALCSETTLQKITRSVQGRETRPSRWDFGIGSVWSTLLILAVVEVDNIAFQSRPTMTTTIQWASFILGYLATADIAQLSPAAVSIPARALRSTGLDFKILDKLAEGRTVENAEEAEPLYVVEGEEEVSLARLHRSSRIFHIALCGLTIALVVLSALNTQAPLFHRLTPRQPPDSIWDLDIVIARYAEPVDHIIDAANLALRNPAMRQLRTRTIVYNKGILNDTELESKFPVDSDLIIKNLENVGREGETYITHLLDEQQDYAKHTLFMQAEPHVTDFLSTRLTNFFVSETGFLSLSHPHRFCSNCDRCNDFSGWSEEAALVHDIFQRSNDNETCQDISLTYRGQFVVSSERMKRVDHELLRDLRSKLLNDATFGYSMERFWGTILQCPRISERCPTMLSEWLGNFGGGHVEDCQCLDG